MKPLNGTCSKFGRSIYGPNFQPHFLLALFVGTKRKDLTIQRKFRSQNGELAGEIWATYGVGSL